MARSGIDSVYSIAMQELTPAEAAARRRRIRRTALWLTGFAMVVYVVFIVSFIKTHQ